MAPTLKTVHPVPPDMAETIPIEVAHEHPSTSTPAQPAESAANLQVGPLTAQEIEKYGYELGYDLRKDLTLEQKSKIEKRKKRRELEKKIQNLNFKFENFQKEFDKEEKSYQLLETRIEVLERNQTKEKIKFLNKIKLKWE